MKQTIFDKIWDSHVVKRIEEGPDVLYIDRHLVHEVTSPQAFAGIDRRGVGVARPGQTFAVCDHNVPTLNQHLPIQEEQSRIQVDTLSRNATRHKLTYFGLGNPKQGVVHVVGPELGITLPGMTIVCGDSHTSTHGACGSIAFGIGTSEVEMTLASQCIMQPKPQKMLIEINGQLGKYVTAKDLVLYLVAQLTAGGCTGYFIEYAGSAIRSLDMEGRMTVCNMSIEMGARGGLIAPDEKTFAYFEGREYAPKGAEWEKAVARWAMLKSDEDATFDKTCVFDASDIEPMITYGTNPGMGMKITDHIPTGEELNGTDKITFNKALQYMGFQPGQLLAGHPVQYVFLGSCTNGRIEDFRAFTDFVKGRQKHPEVVAWLVPGSGSVARQIRAEGLDRTLEAAGFELRQPGCSACLAMNEDKVPAGKYAVSTSNRNFEGRQGPGSRTLLAGPLVAAAAAVTGKVADPREL
ncbi:MAG: 3-isopropylmalate dehydratase large subunit [Bacteroidales bacterium]|jgi:3-isopropylmalate/(R)-2-methylmalate dehydratase large subunit|nr:3-isopropylmalate dehydratase large subunit [Bacteroidales bacterium]